MKSCGCGLNFVTPQESALAVVMEGSPDTSSISPATGPFDLI